MSERDDKAEPTFIEILEATHRRDILAALIQPSLTFHHLPSKDVTFPTDRGLILSRADWQRLRDEVDRFYGMFSEDAVRVCNSRARRVADRAEMKTDLSKARAAGHVYLARTQDNLYRFGICFNLAERRKELKAGRAKPIDIVHSWRVQDMRAAEERLYQHFARRRCGRDKRWLRLQPDEVAWVLEQRDEPKEGERADVVDLALRKRHGRLMGRLRHYVRLVKQEEENAASAYRVLADVDKMGWTDEDALAAFEEYAKNPRLKATISWMAVEKYLPSFMARRENTEHAGTGRADDAGGRADVAPLRATPKGRIGGGGGA